MSKDVEINNIDNVELGKTISQFRMMESYTITQLAEKIGISPSMLSQIERGVSNPSITTLRMLAKVLDVPLFRFFTPIENTSRLVIRKEKRAKIIFPESPVLPYEVLSPNLNHSIAMLLLTLEPQSASAKQSTKHTGEEIAYILCGEVQLILDNQCIVLHEGDSARVPPKMMHQWKNISDDIVKIIFAITPPRI